MLNNTFQLVFKGGDICRIVLLKSAILLALHWLSIETAVQSKFQPLYKGAIASESTTVQAVPQPQFQPQRSDGFYKDNTDKKSPNKVTRMPKIKVALVGVGNCASAFVQGLHYYSLFTKDPVGLRNPQLGGLTPSDIQVVAAFDIDNRKAGKDLSEAIFAKPNNAPRVTDVPSTNIIVNKGPLLDGIGKGTKNFVQISNTPDSNVAEILKETSAEIMINLLPSGAKNASQYYY